VGEPGCEHVSCVSFTINVKDAYSLKNIPGATIVVSDSRGQVRTRATTDSSGDAELHIPYTPDVLYYITVSADGYMPSTATYEPYKLSNMRLILWRLSPYHGRSPSLMTFNIYVYDASSRTPLPNAWVFVTDEADRIKGSIRGVTYEDGRLVLREMIPYYQDDTYLISVFGPGYEPGNVKYTGQQLAGLRELNVNVGLNQSKYGVVTISYEVEPYYEVRGV